MKKEIIIASIFFIMLVASLYNVKYIDRLTGDIIDNAESAADAMAEGDVEQAERHAVRAFELWQSKSFYTHVVLRHSMYETGETSLISLLTDVYSPDEGRVLGSVEAVRRTMEGIAASERISLGSVF